MPSPSPSSASTTEGIQRQGPWRHHEAVAFATLIWVGWFPHRQLLEPLGYVPPAEREASDDQSLAGGVLCGSQIPTAGLTGRPPSACRALFDH